jgi:hypothetical protein
MRHRGTGKSFGAAIGPVLVRMSASCAFEVAYVVVFKEAGES